MLANTLVIQPAQAELTTRILQIGAPTAITQQVSSCIVAARPILTDFYSEEPIRGVVTTFQIWTGMTTYEIVFRTEVPACASALLSAQPYLSSKASQRFNKRPQTISNHAPGSFQLYFGGIKHLCLEPFTSFASKA